MMNVNTFEYKNCNIIIRKNDLTEELSEAIVNPANEQLMHEGGAAKAIANKGGDIIWEESKRYIKKNGNLQTGQSTMTSAGNLPCKYVIHAVGPRYNKNTPDNSLAHAQMKMVTNSIMEIVKKENIESVSIPAISTGIFGFPVGKAAVIIGNTVKSFIDSNSSEMKGKTIVFCNFDDSTVDVFNEAIPNCFADKVQKDRDDEEDNNEENKQVESEGEDKSDSIKICKSCRKEITERKHQARGRHLNLCYRCYKKKKEKKRKEKEREEENEEREEENEESEEDTKANKKMLKSNKKDQGNSSEEIEQDKANKRKSKKNQKKYDKSDEDSESDNKNKKNKKTSKESSNNAKSRKQQSILKSKKKSQSSDSEEKPKSKATKKDKKSKRPKGNKSDEEDS